MFAADDGAADLKPWEFSGSEVVSVHTPTLKLLVSSASDEQFFLAAAAVYNDAVAAVEVFGATENIVELAFGVEVEDLVGSVAVGYVDVAVGGDGRFGRFKLFPLRYLVLGYVEFADDAPV